jgi:phage-related protein
MKLITDNTTIVFEDYGLIPLSSRYDQTPSRRVRKESVIGRDSELTFIDGLNNKQITIEFYVTYSTLQVRRANLREITPELLRGGKLYLNFENDIYWNAKVLNASNISIDFAVDSLSVTFDCKSNALSAIQGGDVAWEDLDISWDLLNMYWNAENIQTTFAAGTHTIYNYGNTTSKPVYVMSGAGTVTIGTESFTVTEACTIDTEKMIVYNGTVNKMSSFTGDYIELSVGTSTLVTDVEVEVQYKDWWI